MYRYSSTVPEKGQSFYKLPDQVKFNTGKELSLEGKSSWDGKTIKDRWSRGQKAQDQLLYCLRRYHYLHYGAGHELKRAQSVMNDLVRHGLTFSNKEWFDTYRRVLDGCKVKVAKRNVETDTGSISRTEKASKVKSDLATKRVSKDYEKFITKYKREPSVKELEKFGKCGPIVAKRVIEKLRIRTQEEVKTFGETLKKEQEYQDSLIPPNPTIKSDSAGEPKFVRPETDHQRKCRLENEKIQAVAQSFKDIMLRCPDPIEPPIEPPGEDPLFTDWRDQEQELLFDFSVGLDGQILESLTGIDIDTLTPSSSPYIGPSDYLSLDKSILTPSLPKKLVKDIPASLPAIKTQKTEQHRPARDSIQLPTRQAKSFEELRWYFNPHEAPEWFKLELLRYNSVNPPINPPINPPEMTFPETSARISPGQSNSIPRGS